MLSVNRLEQTVDAPHSGKSLNEPVQQRPADSAFAPLPIATLYSEIQIDAPARLAPEVSDHHLRSNMSHAPTQKAIIATTLKAAIRGLSDLAFARVSRYTWPCDVAMTRPS